MNHMKPKRNIEVVEFYFGTLIKADSGRINFTKLLKAFLSLHFMYAYLSTLCLN